MNVTLLHSKQVEMADDALSAAILGPGGAARAAYGQAMMAAVAMINENAVRTEIHSGVDSDEMRGFLATLDVCPEQGTGVFAALEEVGVPAVQHALDVGNPATMAHLHCPVAVPALAAEVLISATTSRSIPGTSHRSRRWSRNGCSHG